MRFRNYFCESVVLLILCCTFGALVISFARSSSPTFDETSHLPAGYSYLRWHDFRLNPEHPPFVKKLAALPLLWDHVWPTTLDAPAASNGSILDGDAAIRRAWTAALTQIDAQWPFGHAFLYSVRNDKMTDAGTVSPATQLASDDFHNNADDLVFHGRMAVMLLGLALLVLLYLWSRAMFGMAGAVFSSALLCFDPNFIAHSGLITTDVGESLFIFATMFFLWRVLGHSRAIDLALFVTCFALAFVTKFSAILLIPMLCVVALAAVFSRTPLMLKTCELTTLAGKGTLFLGLLLLAFLTTYLALWASYSFRYSAANETNAAAWPMEASLYRAAALKTELKSRPEGIPPEQRADFERRVSDSMESRPLTVIGQAILFARDHRVLPEAYLYGLAHTEMKSVLRGSFLFGQYSNLGFRSYFLWTFLIKTPLPALLAIAAAVIVALIRRPRGTFIFIFIPIAVYLFASIATHLNIGHRHILPLYPFLYLLCGILAVEWRRMSILPRQLTAALAIAAVVISSQFVFSPLARPQTIHPHYLAYFNEFVGGPRHGYKVLVDSNLDWGQELKNLRYWLDDHKIEGPVWLSYFGMADPAFYGIRHWSVPKVLGGYAFERSDYDQLEAEGKPGDAAQKFLGDLRSGQYIAVSVTNLSGVYLGKPTHDLWKEIFDHATFVDQIGYSIFIYRLND